MAAALFIVVTFIFSMLGAYLVLRKQRQRILNHPNNIPNIFRRR